MIHLDTATRNSPQPIQYEIQIHFDGSFIASNHPDSIALLDDSRKENMLASVLENLRTSLEEDIAVENDDLAKYSGIAFSSMLNPAEMKEFLNDMNASEPLNTWQNEQVNHELQSALEEMEQKKEMQLQQKKEEAEPLEKRDFNLKLIEASKLDRPIFDDRTQIGEDFRFCTDRSEIAKRHMWKRLNFFLVMCRYIKEKAPHLKNFSFPVFRKNQYNATAYFMPASSKKGKYYGDLFARAHISLLSKIVVEKSDHLYVMQGDLELTAGKVRKTTLDQFFNICDLAPHTINSIDWYAEYFLREKAYALLNKVKNGEETFADASLLFARSYGWCLIELQDRIYSGSTKADKHFFNKVKFEEEMNKIMADKANVLKYIDGMLEAIMHFTHNFPALKENLVPEAEYCLYEDVS